MKVPKQIDATVSAAIVEQLQKKGMTLKRIGDLMGLSESTVCRIKNRERSLTIFRLRKLESKLRVPIPVLLLDSIDISSVPKDLKPHYKELRKILSQSERTAAMISKANY